MSDSKNLEEAVRELLVDLCGVLYRHGYQEISVGSLMRLIGVASDRATDHDKEIIDLRQHFQDCLPKPRNQTIAPGTTIH